MTVFFFAPALCQHFDMGRRGLYSAIASALTAAACALAASATPNLPHLADKSPRAIAVDVELVIAVGVSYSMDPDEQALQREGYIMALTSREFMQALREGANSKIAITYFEWEIGRASCRERV